MFRILTRFHFLIQAEVGFRKWAKNNLLKVATALQYGNSDLFHQHATPAPRADRAMVIIEYYPDIEMDCIDYDFWFSKIEGELDAKFEFRKVGLV